MFYVFLDLVGITIGGLLSKPLQKFLSDRQIDSMMEIATLCVGIIGIQGAIKTKQPLLMLISLVIGSVIGVWLDVDGKFNRFGDIIKGKLKTSDPHFVEGFVTVFMIECVGSMSIVGPLDVALSGSTNLMLFKVVLDAITSLVYGAIFGYSVLLSGPFVFLYEAIIYGGASFIQPLLTSSTINEISAVGSLLIVALACDILEIKRFKVANFLPALLGPIIFGLFQVMCK
ncbi:MAG TPA: DUF554 domain-containing protein [Candidatus Ligilactobacillus excrementigallinarum]|uniref:DUF554 domain-containing protein n=1 Tax=Candidatus Ligilactobacillus excrementigallinarum TaxID=2838641 RepID=A0A9D1UWT5_9LACO|nr:DUF554 domain-containing protein [Candidatus Ligilactobacillus excrementigallinarum]